MVNWVPLTADIFSVKSPCCRYDDLFIADEKGISTSFAALLQQTSRCTFRNGFFLKQFTKKILCSRQGSGQATNERLYENNTRAQ